MDRLNPELIQRLDKEQLITVFISLLKKEPMPVRIPLSVFSAPLSSLELAVKYMKESLGYSNKRIALLLNRSPQNIWLTYRNAAKKHPKKLLTEPSQNDIPVSVLAGVSILESIVAYLKDTRGLGCSEIAVLLHRSEKTIKTAYYRSKKRLK